ncbi:MAG: SAM-dependent DNA methyltransferase [Undibacterium sp.]|nr:SAM-dependent DNA methyltransferase [Opitutaceae bacterium]
MAERLKAYGCSAPIPLDEGLNSPEQLDYLDLLPRKKPSPATPAVVAAAIANQGTTLLYVIDGDNEVPAAADLARLQHTLANRSEPAWLAVCTPGELLIYPIGFHAEAATTPIDTVKFDETRAPLFFQSLVQGTYEHNDQLKGSDFVFREIYRLLQQTTEEFVPQKKLKPLDILSMTGRALFFRFLIDRKIVLPGELSEICPTATSNDLKDAFSSAEKAAATSAWLDETFNGDFLRLIDEELPDDDRPAREAAYRRFYNRVEKTAGRRFFAHLEAILRGWPATGDGHQSILDWNDFDFAHIPVGVLSQVYENFSHLVDEEAARQTSVHYTPRLIAELMVNQTFAATPAATRAAAKVLDPSCGAGIFLVLAFRRLVRECWLRDGGTAADRPDTRTIQHILYNQLRGLDLSEAALRLAALSLYITAIELNGTPRPPKNLKFPRSLRDRVLFNVADPGEPTRAFSLGSLGPRAPAELAQAFDIVIGNPPWTRLREEEPENTAARATTRSSKRSASDLLNDSFTEIGQHALRARGFTELADGYENPDKNPDLPFLWRATEWAKPDGLIAFALHARVIARTSGKGADAWRAILRSVQLNGLINGSDLRKTAVWAGMDMPFVLFFARNLLPSPGHRFYFTTPVNDPHQNELGRFRIDYEAAQPISVERVEKQPWVLKTLSLGTWRDVEVMESILCAFPQTLAQAWLQWDKTGEKTGQGYNVSSRLKQKPAPWLAELPDFSPADHDFAIRHRDLRIYRDVHQLDSAHMPRTEALYGPPLVIIPQSPGDDAKAPHAFLSSKSLAFSQSYYGYSCASHPEAETLAALVYLLPHSRLFAYFCLMTSRRTGFDRQTFNKEEFDALPFPGITPLLSPTKTSLRKLAHRLEHDAHKPWDEIDALLFRLYRLDANAQQVIRDTLFSAAAYRRAGQDALKRTTRDSRAPFRDALQTLLTPFFETCGQRVVVAEPAFQPDAWEQPWQFVTVTRAGDTTPVNASVLRRAMQEANKTAASRIIVKLPGERGLLLGLLNQQRWWTVTRARLCGSHLLRHHLGVFGLSHAA